MATSNDRRRLAAVIACLLWSTLAVSNAEAAPPRVAGIKSVPRSILKLERDYQVPATGPQGVLQEGMTLDIVALSGKRYADLEVASIQTGKDATAFRGLTFKPTKGQPTKLASNTLLVLTVRDRGDFDVVADPVSKAWVLLDRQKRDDIAARRLATQRHTLWKPASDDERAAAMKDWDELANKMRAAFSTQQFVRQETEYFVVYTDMPFAQIAGYVANLDAMYQQLCVLFNIPPGTNIWVGKCPIFCFLNRAHFAQFEAQFLDNPNTAGAAGLNHQYSDGKVLTSCFRGDDPAFFANVLVHETAHGFLHRIRSSGRIPPWMNEGIAEWIAAVVVPNSDELLTRFQEAMQVMRQTGSLGGDFLDDDGGLERWQYGVAGTLTQFLLTTDANAYRAMITAIKEGYPWREALDVTYGITPDELATAYGRSIGIPNLRP